MAKEARELAESHPNDPEAWKIAGFAELNLKQYAEAARDLEKAIELQRQANTVRLCALPLPYINPLQRTGEQRRVAAFQPRQRFEVVRPPPLSVGVRQPLTTLI